MKIEVDIDDRLLAEAKAAAADEHTTLARFIEQAIRLRLRSPPATARKRAPGDLPDFDGQGGLRAGIDPASNHSMYDAADP